MSEAQQALNEIRTHERECALRYERIEERLAEGSNKFQKLEKMFLKKIVEELVLIKITPLIVLITLKQKKLK